MNRKLLLCLLFLKSGCLFSQAQTKAEPAKKPEEKVFSRPLSYDSTQTLEEQFKVNNENEFIGLQLFLPPVINPEAGPVVFSKAGAGFEKGNKYYTVIDVLKGNVLDQLKKKNLPNRCGYRYTDFNRQYWDYLIIHAVFVLRDNDKKDSLSNTPLYWVVCESKKVPFSASSFDAFIPTPYFEKQKQTYQGQSVIRLSDKSKWLCKEISLEKSPGKEGPDSTYLTFAWLTNAKGEQIHLRTPSEKTEKTFLTETEYNWLDHANRNEKEELFRTQAEQREKHKADCISRFGEHKGSLVAQGKIETGMSTDMCKAAWGAPWDISITTGTAGTREIWFYNWKYKLHFENGKLIRIEH